MPFIGLTGGLGTGKTTVLGHFKSLGAYTIDADKLVHELLKKPSTIKELSGVLGKGILSKRNSKISIDKKRMADLIFSDALKRRSAEKVIHPHIIKSAKDIKERISAKTPDAVIVFEVPLLFEGGYEKIFDKIIVVYCSKAKAINRAVKKGLSKEQALRRIHAQMPVSKKKKAADYSINNSSTFDALRPQVKAVYKELIKG